MKFIFKIIHFLKFLTVIDLSIIKKSKILIYCPLNFKGIKKITKTKYQLMHKPQDSSNLYILMKMFFNLEFKLIDYLIYYIDRVSPKLIITTYDNDINIYELKKKFPKIKFIILQNGRRGSNHDIFNHQSKSQTKNRYEVDHFFVFGKAIENYFKKFVSANYYCTGSFKNNFFRLSKKKKIDKKKIVFISQFRSFKKNIKNSKKNLIYQGLTINGGHSNLYRKLEFFCLQNKIKLFILPSSIYKSSIFNKEEEYFKNISLTKKIFLIKKKHNLSSYKIINKFDIYFGLDSTFIYEVLSRNKRVGSFSCFENNIFYLFTWPLTRLKKGLFFSNKINSDEIERVYKNITKLNSKEWLEQVGYFKENFMCFDYKNLKLKKLIKNIMNKSNENL